MQYKEYGHFDGPVMMFLHGGGVGGWMWEQQIQHFSKYHCVVPELVSDHSFSIEQSRTALRGKGEWQAGNCYWLFIRCSNCHTNVKHKA